MTRGEGYALTTRKKCALSRPGHDECALYCPQLDWTMFWGLIALPNNLLIGTIRTPHQKQSVVNPLAKLCVHFPTLHIMLRIIVSPRFPLLVRSLATHAATTTPTPVAAPPTRTKEEVQLIYDSPLLDLVFRAASVHRQHHDPSKIQLCTLMNIKSKWLYPKARIAPRRGK